RNQSPVTATRQPEFDHIRCPRLSETLVRDFLKPLSQFSEIRTMLAKNANVAESTINSFSIKLSTSGWSR
ncbi:hypothetical protein, partial [Rhizobium ruizarguesonis]|uniref:hypothetical protein n=1 Tax=Rhizobium ruizarguesonis TaxID=2081791 RepID=UPI001FE1D730